MPDSSEGARRDASYAVFGNRAVVDVVQAVQALDAQDDALITTRAVAARTGMADSVVRPVMNRLARAGVLLAAPRVGGPRSSQYFTIERRSVWDALLALCSEIAPSAPTARHRRRTPGQPKRRSG